MSDLKWDLNELKRVREPMDFTRDIVNYNSPSPSLTPLYPSVSIKPLNLIESKIPLATLNYLDRKRNDDFLLAQQEITTDLFKSNNNVIGSIGTAWMNNRQSGENNCTIKVKHKEMSFFGLCKKKTTTIKITVR